MEAAKGLSPYTGAPRTHARGGQHTGMLPVETARNSCRQPPHHGAGPWIALFGDAPAGGGETARVRDGMEHFQSALHGPGIRCRRVGQVADIGAQGRSQVGLHARRFPRQTDGVTQRQTIGITEFQDAVVVHFGLPEAFIGSLAGELQGGGEGVRAALAWQAEACPTKEVRALLGCTRRSLMPLRRNFPCNQANKRRR